METIDFYPEVLVECKFCGKRGEVQKSDPVIIIPRINPFLTKHTKAT